MRKALVASLLGLVLLAGCGRTVGTPEEDVPVSGPEITEPGKSFPVPGVGAGLPPGSAVRLPETPAPGYPRDEAVLQLGYDGGRIAPTRAGHPMPKVTLWGDGRVVFADPEGVIRDGRLAQDAVDRLVSAAGFLYELGEYYEAVHATDLPSNTFTVLTDCGVKTVFAYGLDWMQPHQDLPHPEALAALRGLWAEVQAALPAGAPALRPDAVRVQTWYSDESPSANWPDELLGCLTGAEARRAVELGGLDEARTFTVDGRPMRVSAVPQLPLPGEPEQPGRDPVDEPGSDLPLELTGHAGDDVLSLGVAAVRENEGTYRVTATLTNKSGHGVDLLFDCGSLLRLRRPGQQPAPDPERTCPAVYSQLLPGGAVQQLELKFDADVLADGGPVRVGVVYETTVNGSGRHELQAVLEPAG